MEINFNVRVEVHHSGDGLVKAINRLGDCIMAVADDLKALTTAIDDATNKVAARIDALAAKITNSMTDAEVTAVKAGLQAEVDRLTALGADPVNPIPPTP